MNLSSILTATLSRRRVRLAEKYKKAQEMKRFLRFVHVPKTAGVTILKSLEQSIEKSQEVADDFEAPSRRWKIIGGQDSYHHKASYQGAFKVYPHGTEHEFLFSFVRNPWDRFVSTYYYLLQTEKIESFESFENFVRYFVMRDSQLLSPERPIDCYGIRNTNADLPNDVLFNFHPQTYWVDTEVDFIGHFENLQNDFNSLCDKLELPHQTLGHENKSNHKPYWEYYNDETEAIIGEKYAEDIEKFGYKFK